MSIAAINPYANWWQWREQATTPSTNSATTSTASSTSGAIGNSGSVSAGGSTSSFMQALSADLQAMLAQSGSDPTSAATATASGQNAASQPDGSVPHHHHHHGGGAQGSMQSAANQLVGAIGQVTQGGTLGSSQINQQASMFATDIVQALQAYGTTATSGSGGSIVA